MDVNEGENIAELHQVAVAVNTNSCDINDADFWKAFDLSYLSENVNSDELEDVKCMLTMEAHIFQRFHGLRENINTEASNRSL